MLGSADPVGVDRLRVLRIGLASPLEEESLRRRLPLRDDVRSVNPAISNFEDSCFSGVYVTGDVTREYLDGVEAQRRDGAKMADRDAESAQLDLGLELVD